jgi:hypothetical protein
LFVNCSKRESRRLTLPGRLTEIDWSNLDFLGWRDLKATNNFYLVLPRDDKVLVVRQR